MNNDTNDIENALEEELVKPKYFLLVDDFESTATFLRIPTMNIEIKYKEHNQIKPMKITDLKSKNIKPIHDNW